MISPLSRFTLVVPLAAAAILAACSSSTSSNNPKPAANVLVTSGAASKTTTAYAPATFTVTLALGGKVTWRNDDNVTHTATDTAAAPTFGTGNLSPGDTASVVFTTAGTYGYHCTIHPGMVGTIIVNP